MALTEGTCGDEVTPCVVGMSTEQFAGVLGALVCLVLLSAVRTVAAFGHGGN
jgi:hypothetical protein